MKVLAIGANGVIGQAVANQLSQNYQVIAVGHSRGEVTVDIEDQVSIRALFEQVGQVDAIVSMAGNAVKWVASQTCQAQVMRRF
ncbi:NAD-dependent epimerase/dehydratase family protein [Vibrio tubiashii]|uniref:NAD-dependent epimerase/dehydratase family protein n=1 Tax=Vibrio tubiashii TaxID=29498 RepID=UPI003CE5C862